MSFSEETPARGNRELSYEHKLHINHWQKASFTERLEVLQQLENDYARRQGREPCQVEPKSREYVGDLGYCYYDTKKIEINEDYLKDKQIHEKIPQETMLYVAVDTVIHEGRHIYQYFALENPHAHDNQAEVELWRANLRDRFEDENNPGGYRFQPTENDAVNYATKEVKDLYTKLEAQYGANRGYDSYQNLIERSDEKYRKMANAWLGDDYEKKLSDCILRDYRELVYGKDHDQVRALDPGKKGGKGDVYMKEAKDLPSNTPSKELYATYAKRVGNQLGANIKEKDNEIIKQMIKDGRPRQRIQDAMRHSPEVEGKSGVERTIHAHKKVQEVLKDPQMREIMKTREKGLER